MTHFQIPEQMTAVVLEAYQGAKALQVAQKPTPRPGPNQVLIKIAASPINPSDLAFIEGSYGFNKPTPVTPGIEGAGVVVAVGSSLMARYLAGKRVACVSPSQGDGTWAEFMVTSAQLALPLDKAVDFEQGAMSIANPLTALAFMEIARRGGHTSIVNTAAASALGQMIERLGRQEGVTVINVVRRPAQVEILKAQGASVVLDSSTPDFERLLKQACRQHNTRLAFDAIAGQMTLQLLEAMPDRSKVTVYGGLSKLPAKAWGPQLIFQGKAIDGFWLTTWLAGRSFLKKLLDWRKAQKLMGDALKTQVRARYSLHEAQKAVLDYQQNMTGGKALITPKG
jgi:NADPH:quinone reductase-like Zn-dependent oxidoreductase